MEVDRSKCIIRQQDKSKPLKHPLESFLTGSEVFYLSVQHSGRLNLMPCPTCIAEEH